MADAAMTCFRVTHALVRGLARTFADALTLEPSPEPIDVTLAHAQHDKYTALLRALVPQVIGLSADDACPDCVFIEDTALVVNEGHAIVTRPGAPSRRPEPEPVLDMFCSLGFQRISSIHAPATLDGGDVLVLPWAVLVGISKRTNDEAVAQLAAQLTAAGGPPVYSFSVVEASAAVGAANTLHFKSVLSALDPYTLLVADIPTGHALATQIRAVPELASRLQLVFLPDTIAANVLSINRDVVMQEGYPASEEVIRRLCAERGMRLHTLQMSEMAKADGALTCCSLLFAAPDMPRSASQMESG